MTVTTNLGYVAPHQVSAQGLKAADSNRALRNTRIPMLLNGLQTVDFIKDGNLQFGIGSATFSAPTAGGQWDDSAAAASKFTSDLVDINDVGTADVLVFPASEAAPDKFILGFSATGGVPAVLKIEDTGGTAGIGGTGRWVYLSKAGVWTAFAKVVDLTSGFTASVATKYVSFQIPDDWAPVVESEIDTVQRWYLAFECLTVYSTNPVLDKVSGLVLAPASIASTWQAPLRGLVTHFRYGATAGGTNNDTIVEILNFTRATRGLVTLTGNPALGQFALSVPLYVELGDEIGIVLVQADGTTEILNFTSAQLLIQP